MYFFFFHFLILFLFSSFLRHIHYHHYLTNIFLFAYLKCICFVFHSCPLEELRGLVTNRITRTDARKRKTNTVEETDDGVEATVVGRDLERRELFIVLGTNVSTSIGVKLVPLKHKGKIYKLIKNIAYGRA